MQLERLLVPVGWLTVLWAVNPCRAHCNKTKHRDMKLSFALHTVLTYTIYWTCYFTIFWFSKKRADRFLLLPFLLWIWCGALQGQSTTKVSSYKWNGSSFLVATTLSWCWRRRRDWIDPARTHQWLQIILESPDFVLITVVVFFWAGQIYSRRSLSYDQVFLC